MNTAYVLIGGNLGNRKYYLQQAIEQIQDVVSSIISISSVFETAAWGKVDQPPFLNQSLCIETTFEAEAFLINLLEIEKKLGRERLEKMGPRTIDIDILFFNDLVLKTKILTVPHPYISERRFVLTPLVEIAPELMHPVLQKTTTELLQICPDPLPVYKVGDEDS